MEYSSPFLKVILSHRLTALTAVTVTRVTEIADDYLISHPEIDTETHIGKYVIFDVEPERMPQAR